MSTKFVVLWLQTIFITTEDGNDIERNFIDSKHLDDNETVLQSENKNSLEDALRFYNAKAADDTVQQVMILVSLKDFNRAAK